jgi:hypothetical protein
VPQPDPELTDVVLGATTPRGAGVPGSRRIDDAWEAVVREELVRVRRGHARDRRRSRAGDVLRPSGHRPPEGNAAS